MYSNVIKCDCGESVDLDNSDWCYVCDKSIFAEPKNKIMENKQTAMMDFAVHLRQMKNQLMKDYQNQRADYYVVRIFEGLELKALGFLGQEKEQIMDAFVSGEHQQGFENEAELYYKQTYESNS